MVCKRLSVLEMMIEINQTYLYLICLSPSIPPSLLSLHVSRSSLYTYLSLPSLHASLSNVPPLLLRVAWDM